MRKHTIFQNGKQEDIPFTPEEEAAEDLREAELLAKKPMEKWVLEMVATDAIMVAGLARTLEDLLDANPGVLAKKSRSFKENHSARKIIRARRVKI
ncbi:MAG: hypothetical protein HQL70_09545 [Magnetococcales bacterium]|nr:hypothetical protein [Magnetococcales bacterium]